MKPRLLVTGLALTLALQAPVTARADESDTTISTNWHVRAPSVVDLRLPHAFVEPQGLLSLAPSPQDIRLSRGAIIAIIVVGVVVIALGLFVVVNKGPSHGGI